MQIFTIGINDAGQRADKFLKKACPKLPHALLYKAFRKKDIKCAGKRCLPETILQCGDELCVYLPDNCFEIRKSQTAQQTAETLPKPEILFENHALAVLYKPVGIPVHADDSGTKDTLIARFLSYLIEKGDYLPEAEQSFTPALCNRLDRNTEGIVLAAKTAASLRCMNEKIRLGEVQKQYLCITVGAPPQKKDIVTAYHRKGDHNHVTLSSIPASGFREIRTGYEVLAQSNELSLLRVTLYTGRTHQIRAQLAALHCPILGDARYGNMDANKRYHERFQLLAAYRIQFAFSSDDCCLSTMNHQYFRFVPSFCKRYFPHIAIE
ncbi:MAG: RluA family pseudouridine synthase [Oscillospiraceae bacterium]|nr:RluA family pseudouridine synthase [Oscillospiraceae bacterium]